MTATSLATVPERAVQLTLVLPGVEPGRGRRSRRLPRPYWDRADACDLGGRLTARSDNARIVIDAEALPDGTWRGHYDAMWPGCGVSGGTKQMPLRADALASAAHAVATPCRRILARAEREPKCTVRAARETLRWLALLDLL